MPDTTSSTLVAVLGTLRRRWVLAVLGGLAVVAVWMPFVMGLPDLYRASATILVAGHLSDSINQSSDAGALDRRLQAIKQESLSRTQLTDLVERFHLYPEKDPEISMGDAIGRLQKDIQLGITSTSQSTGGTSTLAFKLSYLGRDPKTVADVTNTLASFYAAQNSSLGSREGDEFRILDAALPPLAPAGPNRFQLYIGGAFLATVLGLALAFVRDRFDTSFHSLEELREFTLVPILASIPVIGPTRDVRSQALRATALAAAAGIVLGVAAAGAFHYAHGNETMARMLLPRG